MLFFSSCMCDAGTGVCIALAVPWDMQDVQLPQRDWPRVVQCHVGGMGTGTGYGAARLTGREAAHRSPAPWFALTCAQVSCLALLSLIPRAAG